MSPYHEKYPRSIGRAVMYAAVFVAGTMYLLQPSETVQKVLGKDLAQIWAWFLVIGGLLCLASYLKPVVAEYIGLPLIATALLIYGIGIVMLEGADPRWLPRPGALLFIGTGIHLAYIFVQMFRKVMAHDRVRRMETPHV